MTTRYGLRALPCLRHGDGNSRKHCSRTSSKRDEKSDTIQDDVAAAKP